MYINEYDKICKCCGEEFQTTNNIKKFCSDMCYKSYKRDMIKYKKRETQRLKTLYINSNMSDDINVCFKCHNLFVGQGNYCSSKCRSQIDTVEQSIIATYKYLSKICSRCGKVLDSNYSTYCINCTID